MNTFPVDYKANVSHSLLQTPPDHSLGYKIVCFGRKITGDLIHTPRIQVIPTNSLFQKNAFMGCVGIIAHCTKRICTMPLDHTLCAITYVALECLGTVVYQIEKWLPSNSQAQAIEETLIVIDHQLDQLAEQSSEKQEIIDSFKTVLATYKEIKILSNKVDAEAEQTKPKIHALIASVNELDEMIRSLLHATSFQDAILELFIPLSTRINSIYRSTKYLSDTHETLKIDQARIRKKALKLLSTAPARNQLLLTHTDLPTALDLKA
jgi:galactitol-specific phosphotransferase system IIB component